MCGIVGYVGGRPALGIVLDGLRRLEYRGYDSAGVAICADGAILTEKRAGKLANLEKALGEGGAAEAIATGMTGIGHTRWATHGGPTDRNAHPHLSARRPGRCHPQRHHRELREASCRDRGRRRRIRQRHRHRVRGAPARGRADRRTAGGSGGSRGARRRDAAGLPTAGRRVHAARHRRGRARRGRRRPAQLPARGRPRRRRRTSSPATCRRFIEHTREAVELGQDQVVLITADGIEITDFDGAPAERPRLPHRLGRVGRREGRLRLLHAQGDRRAAAGRRRHPARPAHRVAARSVLDEVRLTDQDLRDVDKVFIVACGTSYHAGLVAKYAIEHWTRIPCEVELASEFRYRDPVLDRSTLVVAISQSGETMDTLMALRHAKEQKARVLAICNTNGSTIPRESDAVLYTHGGPEIAVASTKAFLTQLVACYLIGLHLAQVRGIKYADEVGAVVAQLQEMPDKLRAGAGQDGAGARAGPRPRRRRHGPVHRPARGLPGGARGRAQAQGAGLHARRGLRGGRAEARADRADRPGHAGGVRGAVAAPAAACCTTRSCRTSRRYAPAAPAPS